MTGLTGHRLADDGAGHRSRGACLYAPCDSGVYPGARMRGFDGQTFGGHAQCQCGQESPHLFSNRERRGWHRQHKATLG